MDDPYPLPDTGPLPPCSPASGRLELIGRDLHRRYAIEASVDLFGVHLVETSWGRAGKWGQCRRFAYDSADEAQRAVTAHLRRRARAPRRIGVSYVVIGE